VNPKVLIVLVVLLVILFVVGTGASIVNGNNSSPNLDQPWLSVLGNVFTPHVGIGDLSVNPSPPNPAGCTLNQTTRQISVPAAATCTFTISSSHTDVRRIELHLLGAGSSVMATVSQIDPFSHFLDTQSVSGSVGPSEAEIVLDELKVYKDDGQPTNVAQLAIQCVSGSTCNLPLT
jgi:hypothetical protein